MIYCYTVRSPSKEPGFAHSRFGPDRWRVTCAELALSAYGESEDLAVKELHASKIIFPFHKVFRSRK